MLLHLESGLIDEPPWPEQAANRPVLVLLDAPTRLERQILNDWVDRNRPPETRVTTLKILPSRRRLPGYRTDPALTLRLERDQDTYMFPLRVAWLAPERGGERTAQWIDILKLGDPRDPNPLHQQLILARHPDRIRIIQGSGASASEIRQAHRDSVEVLSLEDFATRKAHRVLDRAERELRGNRYKVPRFLHVDILAGAEFRDGVLRIASETGMPAELAFAKARYYLREMAAGHSTFLIDLIAVAIHWLYTRGYNEILYDHERIQEIARLGQEHPIAFLPSHRSQLDRLSLQYVLWQNDLPPNHTAAGINLNFFPVGPLIRRTGAFFIRRSFRDNPLYKHVLKSYLDYLVEKRFPLEWYMEGGRSRTGKLLPPKLGMLSWVVDSVRRGKSEDLYLIPTSIAYDQVQDLAALVAESQGAVKEKESFAWLFSSVRSLRRRYGNIHIRFAEPISIAKEVPSAVRTEEDIEIQKLAFEVMYRISRVTPVTPTSVVSIALLAGRGSASTAAELTKTAADIDQFVEERQLPLTEPLPLEDPAATQHVLDRLVAHGSVSLKEDGYSLSGHQALHAAYYRNSIVHYFVPGAIAEMALLVGGGTPEGVWDAVWRIRDLLKFEFFFSERETFRVEIELELDDIDHDWRRQLDQVESMLAAHTPLKAHWAVLPFLEAYQIVADELSEGGPRDDEKEFIKACLDRGKRARSEGQVISPEAVSKPLFVSALTLAGNLDLIGSPPGRDAFATEIAELRHAAEKVAELANVQPQRSR